MSEKTPSFIDMMKTFSKEVVEFAKQGAPHVNRNQYKERLAICDGCKDLRRDVMRCGKCGCLVEQKAKWATSNCPEKKWPAIKVGQHGKKVTLKAKKRDGSEGNNTKTSK